MREYLHRPTVSIIIPCFNNEKFVGEALESLRNQTFGDWEAVVVNDGSTDDSEAVIRKYQSIDTRVHCVAQENRGLPAARNTGLACAKGEFVNFLDADDLLFPEMLQKMVQKLVLNSSFGAASCGWIWADSTLDDLNWKISSSHQGQLFGKLAHGNLFPCHAVLLRRKILEQTGEFDCSLKHCHDWDLWLRVARAGIEFISISEPLVIYRMLPHSLSRNPESLCCAGKEVICRGHRADPRVKNPAAGFVQGCQCLNVELPLRNWLLYCVGLAIAQGDPVQASALFESTFNNGNIFISPKIMKALTHALYFGTATPTCNRDSLPAQTGRTLLEFLLIQEERLELPGFALQSVLEMFEVDSLPLKSDPENMSLRALLMAFKRKAVRCLSQTKGRS